MTEDDKELLRLAAKAYWGDEIDDVVSIELSEYENAILYTHVDNQDHNGNDVAMRWNPLEEDYDNRRLQIKLRLGLVPQEDGAWVCIKYDGEGNEVTLAVDEDPNLAIVRSAADIGRNML